MCGQLKPATEFRWMQHRNRYNSYCKDCERFYRKLYMRVYRERKKDEIN